MSNFCLKQGLGLKASVAQLHPNFPECPPGLIDRIQQIPDGLSLRGQTSNKRAV